MEDKNVELKKEIFITNIIDNHYHQHEYGKDLLTLDLNDILVSYEDELEELQIKNEDLERQLDEN